MTDHAPRSLIAAIDQGTTSSRCLLFDRGGQAVASHQLEHRQITPKPGWVEHDPEEIWSGTVATVREAMAEAKVTANDVAAIGITNQRETVVVWDRSTGKPIHNAIVRTLSHDGEQIRHEVPVELSNVDSWGVLTSGVIRGLHRDGDRWRLVEVRLTPAGR